MGHTQCCADLPQQQYDQGRRNLTLRQKVNGNTSHFRQAKIPNMHREVDRINSKLGPFCPKNIINNANTKKQTWELNKEGLIYHGVMENGFPQTMGELFYPDQSYYSGMFRRGVSHGQGRFINPSGWYYQGNIQNEQAEGQGIYVNEKIQYQYEGDWAGDLPDGHGKETWQTKYISYQGEFQKGRKHGFGRYHNSNLWEYEGNFSDNQIHFQGVIKYSNGQKYKGDFKKGKKHGFGVYTWPDHSKYEGGYKEDRKHGIGKYTTSKGDVFEGEWYDGKRQGVGTLIKNGKQVILEWRDDFIR